MNRLRLRLKWKEQKIVISCSISLMPRLYLKVTPSSLSLLGQDAVKRSETRLNSKSALSIPFGGGRQSASIESLIPLNISINIYSITVYKLTWMFLNHMNIHQHHYKMKRISDMVYNYLFQLDFYNILEDTLNILN